MDIYLTAGFSVSGSNIPAHYYDTFFSKRDRFDQVVAYQQTHKTPVFGLSETRQPLPLGEIEALIERFAGNPTVASALSSLDMAVYERALERGTLQPRKASPAELVFTPREVMAIPLCYAYVRDFEDLQSDEYDWIVKRAKNLHRFSGEWAKSSSQTVVMVDGVEEISHHFSEQDFEGSLRRRNTVPPTNVEFRAFVAKSNPLAQALTERLHHIPMRTPSVFHKVDQTDFRKGAIQNFLISKGVTTLDFLLNRKSDFLALTEDADRQGKKPKIEHLSSEGLREDRIMGLLGSVVYKMLLYSMVFSVFFVEAMDAFVAHVGSWVLPSRLAVLLEKADNDFAKKAEVYFEFAFSLNANSCIDGDVIYKGLMSVVCGYVEPDRRRAFRMLECIFIAYLSQYAVGNTLTRDAMRNEEFRAYAQRLSEGIDISESSQQGVAEDDAHTIIQRSLIKYVNVIDPRYVVNVTATLNKVFASPKGGGKIRRDDVVNTLIGGIKSSGDLDGLLNGMKGLKSVDVAKFVEVFVDMIIIIVRRHMVTSTKVVDGRLKRLQPLLGDNEDKKKRQKKSSSEEEEEEEDADLEKKVKKIRLGSAKAPYVDLDELNIKLSSIKSMVFKKYDDAALFLFKKMLASDTLPSTDSEVDVLRKLVDAVNKPNSVILPHHALTIYSRQPVFLENTNVTLTSHRQSNINTERRGEDFQKMLINITSRRLPEDEWKVLFEQYIRQLCGFLMRGGYMNIGWIMSHRAHLDIIYLTIPATSQPLCSLTKVLSDLMGLGLVAFVAMDASQKSYSVGLDVDVLQVAKKNVARIGNLSQTNDTDITPVEMPEYNIYSPTNAWNVVQLELFLRLMFPDEVNEALAAGTITTRTKATAVTLSMLRVVAYNNKLEDFDQSLYDGHHTAYRTLRLHCALRKRLEEQLKDTNREGSIDHICYGHEITDYTQRSINHVVAHVTAEYDSNKFISLRTFVDPLLSMKLLYPRLSEKDVKIAVSCRYPSATPTKWLERPVVPYTGPILWPVEMMFMFTDAEFKQRVVLEEDAPVTHKSYGKGDLVYPTRKLPLSYTYTNILRGFDFYEMAHNEIAVDAGKMPLFMGMVDKRGQAVSRDHDEFATQRRLQFLSLLQFETAVEKLLDPNLNRGLKLLYDYAQYVNSTSTRSILVQLLIDKFSVNGSLLVDMNYLMTCMAMIQYPSRFYVESGGTTVFHSIRDVLSMAQENHMGIIEEKFGVSNQKYRAYRAEYDMFLPLNRGRMIGSPNVVYAGEMAFWSIRQILEAFQTHKIYDIDNILDSDQIMHILYNNASVIYNNRCAEEMPHAVDEINRAYLEDKAETSRGSAAFSLSLERFRSIFDRTIADRQLIGYTCDSIADIPTYKRFTVADSNWNLLRERVLNRVMGRYGLFSLFAKFDAVKYLHFVLLFVEYFMAPNDDVVLDNNILTILLSTHASSSEPTRPQKDKIFRDIQANLAYHQTFDAWKIWARSKELMDPATADSAYNELKKASYSLPSEVPVAGATNDYYNRSEWSYVLTLLENKVEATEGDTTGPIFVTKPLTKRRVGSDSSLPFLFEIRPSFYSFLFCDESYTVEEAMGELRRSGFVRAKDVFNEPHMLACREREMVRFALEIYSEESTGKRFEEDTDRFENVSGRHMWIFCPVLLDATNMTYPLADLTQIFDMQSNEQRMTAFLTASEALLVNQTSGKRFESVDVLLHRAKAARDTPLYQNDNMVPMKTIYDALHVPQKSLTLVADMEQPDLALFKDCDQYVRLALGEMNPILRDCSVTVVYIEKERGGTRQTYDVGVQLFKNKDAINQLAVVVIGEGRVRLFSIDQLMLMK